MAYANGNGWKMRWEPKVIRNIYNLNSRNDLEVLWATTWVGHTQQLERLFLLPPLRSAGPAGMDWADKREAAEKVLARGHRLIWTDDEAIPLTWTSNDDMLLIRPRPSRGLRPEHIVEIEEFMQCT